MSAYDTTAPVFDRYRSLPAGVPEAIRSATVAGAGDQPRPRVLDLGAGTGRIGKPFAEAGDACFGVDLSLGMLREFAGRSRENNECAPDLVQADGERLPFRDGIFDVVMLIQVLGGAHGWRRLLGETRRVTRARGALVIGQAAGPAEGIDVQK